LKILYQIKNSEYLRFGGGTCLRICHNLPRYSEDLDFSLDQKAVDTKKIMNELQFGFKEQNVDFELFIPEAIDRKIVKKYWLKFPNLLHAIGYSPHRSQKFFIKLEIDSNPPKKGKGEFFYVEKFNEYFPIFKSDLPTLFAGKIGAVCERGYHAMRDFYDLLWYLNKKILPNYEELQEIGINIKNSQELINLLTEKTKDINGDKLLSDLGEFLENSVEKQILKNYHQVFNQAGKRFLEEG